MSSVDNIGNKKKKEDVWVDDFLLLLAPWSALVD